MTSGFRKSGIRHFFKEVKRDKLLILLVTPALLTFFLFNYLPMAGIWMAFSDFKPNLGIFGSPFVGLRWFIQLFESAFLGRIIINTLVISIYSVLWGFWVPIVFALMLNEVKNRLFKRVVQSVTYFPYFISIVVTVGIMVTMLSMKDGVINAIIKNLGYEPVEFLKSVKWFRTLYIGTGIWQSFGFSAILYLGAISSVDPQIYEAATVDGAGRMKKIWYITLPAIMPIAITMLILTIGNLLNVGFEKIILMYDPANYSVSDVISTYVYRRGLLGAQYSFGTAVGFLNSVINLVLIVLANQLAKKTVNVYLW